MILRHGCAVLAMVFFPLFGFGHGIVGNGGSVVRDGDRLCLSDFYYAFETCGDVFIGKEKSAELERRWRSLGMNPAMKAIFPEDLLLRKLTDLGRLHPLLGETVLELIGEYAWVFDERVDTPPAATAFPNKPGMVDVLGVAVRNRQKISLSPGRWRALSAEQQVGIVVHEMFYALLTPKYLRFQDCKNPRLCQAPSIDIFALWRTVSAAFTRDVLSGTNTRASVHALSLPAWPESEKTCPRWIDLRFSTRSDSSVAKMPPLCELGDTRAREAFIIRACEIMVDYPAAEKLTLQMVTPATTFHLVWESYEARFGSQTQAALRSSGRDERSRYFFYERATRGEELRSRCLDFLRNEVTALAVF